MRKLILRTLFWSTFALIALSACNEADIKYKSYYSDGLKVYQVHCQNCHMDDGSGLGNLIPPLTDTSFLKVNRKKLPCFINYGLQDSIIIHGKIYKEVMPAEQHLAPIDVAKVLTYITNTFGNQQGIYDVTEVEKNLKLCR